MNNFRCALKDSDDVALERVEARVPIGPFRCKPTAENLRAFPLTSLAHEPIRGVIDVSGTRLVGE